MPCKKILLIEDEKAIQQMMQDVLELNGYEVHTATNGEEGIHRLRSLDPLPCLILLDLMMPGMNGWQFLDFQRTDPRLQNIPVVVCSAYKESARSIRPSAIVDKPVQLKSLLGAVEAFCS